MAATYLADLVRDASLAVRQARRRPAVSAAAVLTLTLGLGAPTAVFAVVHAVLLRPLPFADPDRLVRFRLEIDTPHGRGGFDALPVDLALDWARDSTQLSSLALFNDAAMTLDTPAGPERLQGVSASPALFDLLGTRPELGRTFASDEPDEHTVVVSHAAWLRFFGGDPGAVGAIATLDGRPYRVLGVMPAGFDFPAPETAFWTPVRLSGGARGMILPAIGRLAPGATPDGAAAEGLSRFAASGGASGRETIVVRSLREQQVGGVSRLLWLLMGAVAIVSLIATVNIALLLLTSGAGRAREFVIRRTLGAGRARLVRQVLAEAAVLAAAGGLAGLAFARIAMAAFVRLAPPEVPRLHETALDPTVLAFSGTLVLAATLLTGLLGAGRVFAADDAGARPRPRAASPWRADAATGTASRRRLHALATVELALAMVLLAGAGVLLRGFVGLAFVDPGFDTHDRIAFRVSLPSARYPTPQARLSFDQQLLTRLRALPDVVAAGIVTAMPGRQPSGRFAYDATGMPDVSDPTTLRLAEVRMATDGFVEAMGLRLRRGRSFRPDDGAGSDPVVIIDAALARAQFGNTDPIGRLLHSGSGTRRVIGVVDDVRHADPDALQQDPSAYLPLAQASNVLGFAATANVVVHARQPEARVADLVAVVRSIDPDLPAFDVRTLDRLVGAQVAGPRFATMMIGLFALVALVMAVVGVYGVMAFGAQRREKELGVRLALGATGGQVLRLVLRDGAMVVGVGLAAGLVAARALSGLLTGVVEGVRPADPVAFAAVAALLLATGLTASYLPARRASRASVVAVLRED